MKKLLLLTIIPVYGMQESKLEIVVHTPIHETKAVILPNVIADEPKRKKLKRYAPVRPPQHFFVSQPYPSNLQRYEHATNPRIGAIHPMPQPRQPERCPRAKCFAKALCIGAMAMGSITAFIYWVNYNYSH